MGDIPTGVSVDIDDDEDRESALLTDHLSMLGLDDEEVK